MANLIALQISALKEEVPLAKIQVVARVDPLNHWSSQEPRRGLHWLQLIPGYHVLHVGGVGGFGIAFLSSGMKFILTHATRTHFYCVSLGESL